jgi:hypothetical protein
MRTGMSFTISSVLENKDLHGQEALHEAIVDGRGPWPKKESKMDLKGEESDVSRQSPIQGVIGS